MKLRIDVQVNELIPAGFVVVYFPDEEKRELTKFEKEVVILQLQNVIKKFSI